MRIDRLTVQNFRCFESRTFDLTPQFNVFIGANGSGKTALLEALSVALGSWLLELDMGAKGKIQTSDVRLNGQRIGEQFTFEEQYPVSVSAEGNIYGDTLRWRRSRLKASGTTTAGEAGEIKQLAARLMAQVRDGQEVTLPVIAYYGTGRLWQPPPPAEVERLASQRSLSRLEGYRRCMEERINARELTKWMDRQDRIAYQEKREPLLLRVVRQAMRQMLPNATDVHYDGGRLEIVVTFNDGTVQPFGHLSDGQRNMVGLAGDLAMRIARLNPQLGDEVLQQTPGVVLIDELDLHLHTAWQRTIVQRLTDTFPKCQFIATTHSPQIVGEVAPERVFVLQAGGTVATPHQSLGMDTNFILEFLMNTDERDEQTKSDLKCIARLIEEEQYTDAEQEITRVRSKVGDFAELVRLQTRIDRIRLLSK